VRYGFVTKEWAVAEAKAARVDVNEAADPVYEVTLTLQIYDASTPENAVRIFRDIVNTEAWPIRVRRDDWTAPIEMTLPPGERPHV
jgi:hypothetical protein